LGDVGIAQESYMGKRGERETLSRLVNRPSRPSRDVTIIGIVADKTKEGVALEHPQMIVFTMFGGPCAPKEPGDPSLKPEEVEASLAFWAEHALAVL
jgi:hypothetical protein